MSIKFPHGYASDRDALWALVMFYAAAQLELLRAYYEAPAVDYATLHKWGRYEEARCALSTVWARGRTSLDDEPIRPSDPRRAAWLQVVEDDLRARLAGDFFSRPLPEPEPYESPAPATDQETGP